MKDGWLPGVVGWVITPWAHGQMKGAGFVFTHLQFAKHRRSTIGKQMDTKEWGESVHNEKETTT